MLNKVKMNFEKKQLNILKTNGFENMYILNKRLGEF